MHCGSGPKTHVESKALEPFPLLRWAILWVSRGGGPPKPRLYISHQDSVSFPIRSSSIERCGSVPQLPTNQPNPRWGLGTGAGGATSTSSAVKAFWKKEERRPPPEQSPRVREQKSTGQNLTRCGRARAPKSSTDDDDERSCHRAQGGDVPRRRPKCERPEPNSVLSQGRE